MKAHDQLREVEASFRTHSQRMYKAARTRGRQMRLVFWTGVLLFILAIAGMAYLFTSAADEIEACGGIAKCLGGAVRDFNEGLEGGAR